MFPAPDGAAVPDGAAATPRHTRLRALAAIAVVTAVSVPVALAPPASAHVVLLSSSPKDGARLARPPAKVSLTFRQPPISTGATVQVTGPEGVVSRGRPEIVDSVLSQPIERGAPAGTYRVVWRVTSPDGHPVSGDFSFRVAKAGGSTTPTVAPSTAAPSGVAARTTTNESSAAPWLLAAAALIVILALAAVIARRRTPGKDSA
jgi:methionine-rich copper-binding protein CopC